MPAAVECSGLQKSYGPHQALCGLDLEVPSGSLFGFLGPNGAGKSTTLRILAGLIRADAGSARVHGVDVSDHVAAAADASFLVEDAVFPGHLTARETIKRAAAYAGIDTDLGVLERVGISYAAERKTGGFSHGMRQRLGLACSLLGAPQLLVLDEPQNGLDPKGLQMIRGILQEEHARGATVLVSVHRLAEVEGLCTHAAIIVSGRTLRSGAVEDLLRTEDARYRLRVNDLARARAVIAEALPDLGCDAQDGVLILKATEAQAADAAAACVGADVRVFELALQRHTLDDLYLSEVDR